MDDFFTHLESVGVSFVDSPAAADYAKAKTEDLALHAVSITMALRLPRRGSAVLGVMNLRRRG